MSELHGFLYWFAIGGLTWGGILGIVVLFMMGAHRDDERAKADVDFPFDD